MLKIKQIMIILLCFLTFFSSTTFTLAIELEQNDITLNITIRNELEQKNYLQKDINFNSELSIMNILDEMANKQYIKTYEIKDNNIYAITPIDLPKITNQNNNSWSYYINGAEFKKDVKKTILNDNDNIEIIYKNNNYGYTPKNNSKAFDESQLIIEPDWNDDLNNILANAINYLKLNSNNQSYVSAIALSGNFMDISEFNRLVAISNKKQYNTPMEISDNVLALTFSGVNAQDVRGNDLLEKIYNLKDYNIQGAIGVAYMLLAIDSDNYQIPVNAINTREKLVKYLLNSQNKDGGFANPRSEKSEVLDTTLVLTALSKYKNQDEVSEAIRNGLSFLSKKDYNNCTNLSGLIIALKSLNISLDDPRFAKNQNNLIEELITYIDSDGGFKNSVYSKSEIYATEMAVIALISLKKNHNPYSFKDSVQSGYSTEAEKTLKSKKQVINKDLFYDIITIAGLLIITLILIILRKNFRKELLNEK